MNRIGTDMDVQALPHLEFAPGDLPGMMGSMGELVEREIAWESNSRATHELLWTASGAGTVTIGEETYTVTPQLGLWLPAGACHSGFTPLGTCQRVALFSIGGTPQFSDRPVPVEITPLLQLLLKRLQVPGLDERSRSLSEAMIVDVLQPAERDLRVRIPASELLQPIVEALRQEPGNRFSLEQWAEQLEVSTKTVTRSFRAETGLSFSRWRATVRAQHAVVLLAAGMEIEDVAFRTGYHSASAFGAAFRRVTGKTPGFFRSTGGE
ncbi:HTH-type transcriptional repressor of iron proteins A [Corynebacterium occultum]|uniref:HTH-type transcriptional regulator RipA n=1 Tax=Corynebacterium occultum TaxID=2675219 RepID=A0A6B8W5P9_9CORY|nr:AraC family transcriptional regulator [Corynebacterium occultum]QGU07297.1 HTH-type transcriptional repressor of iron proteins A [Corynebacterium occultum]